MDRRRRRVLVVGLVLAAIVGLFPPWERRAVLDSGPVVVQAGHAPLFLPPKPPLSASVRVMITYNVAYGRLLTYWAIILLATGAAYVLAGQTPKRGV